MGSQIAGHAERLTFTSLVSGAGEVNVDGWVMTTVQLALLGISWQQICVNAAHSVRRTFNAQISC